MVDLVPRRNLDLELLRDGFNDKPGVVQRLFERPRGRRATHFAKASVSHQLRQRLGHVVDRGGALFGAWGEDSHGSATAGEHQRDAATQRSRSDHRDRAVLDVLECVCVRASHTRMLSPGRVPGSVANRQSWPDRCPRWTTRFQDRLRRARPASPVRGIGDILWLLTEVNALAREIVTLMADVDQHASQRDLVPDIPAELHDAGFEDVAEIGRGGFGVVYRCAQPMLDRTVAVKVLTADLDQENLDRFLREQHAMGRLSGHPNIVTILQVGTTTRGRPFIVMPYHAKNSLEALIRRHGPLDWRETLRIGVKLAGALEAANRAGILHRDVKPGNILLSEYGEPELTDFGIARIAGGFQTATGVITGSPAFTAPEVLEGKTPTPASDVYSLGATLFCALTGHAAFERRSGEKVVAQFLRITSQPIPDLRERGFPAEVAAVIERAMARDPAARPVSAAAFGDELREVQRLLGAAVDEMARPVELGVERRTSPMAAVGGSAGHRYADAPDTDDEIPTAGSDPIAGGPQPAVRRPSGGRSATVGPYPRALGLRQEHAGGPVARASSTATASRSAG